MNLKIDGADVSIVKTWEHIDFIASKEGVSCQKVELIIDYASGNYRLETAGEEAVCFKDNSVEEGFLKLTALKAAMNYLWEKTKPKNDFPFVEK